MERFSWNRWVRSLSNRTARTVRKTRPLAVESLEARETPATFTWDGGSNLSSNWTDPANWVGNVAPNPGTGLHDLSFPQGAARLTNTNNFPVGSAFNSISIGGNGYVLNGNRLTLGSDVNPGSGSVFVSSTATTATINLGLTLAKGVGTNHDFAIASGGTLNYTGALSGSAGAGLAKTGDGTLILAANNSAFTGEISINQGILRASNASALGDSLAKTTVASNAQLQISGAGTINEPLTLNGPGLSGAGGLFNASGNNIWSGAITLDANSTIGTAGGTLLEVSGSIGDASQGLSLTKEGTGTLLLSSGNTYLGTTTVNDGVLAISHAAALGPVGGGYFGRTIVNESIGKAGTLRIDGPAGGSLVIEDELLELNGDGFSSTGALRSTTGNNAWTGDVHLGSPSPDNRAVTIRVDAPQNTIDPVPSLTIGSGVPFGVSGNGIISTPYTVNSLTKTGLGTLILTSANTFDGSVTVAAGALQISDSQALGTTAAGTSVSRGAALWLAVDDLPDSITGTTNTLVIDEGLSLTAFGLNGTGALRSVSGINLITSDIGLGGRTTIGVDPDPNPNATRDYFDTDFKLTHTGDLSGGPLLKAGTGQLVLPEANTNFSSNIEIHEGWITISDSESLGAYDPDISPNNQATIFVYDGAALHLRPDAINEQFTIAKQFRISGTGITHPYVEDAFNPGTGGISQNGAILSLNGVHELSGLVVQNSRAGIGAVSLDPDVFPASQLYLTNKMSDAPRLVRADESSGGLELEHSTLIPVLGASGTLTIDFDTFGAGSPDNIRIYFGERGTPGSVLLYDSSASNYPAAPPSSFGNVTITTTFGPNSATTSTPAAGSNPVLFQGWRAGGSANYATADRGFIEIVVNEEVNDQGNGVADTWEFRATLQENDTNAGLVKLGDQMVVLQGNGTYGGDVEVNEGVLVVQNHTALGLGNGSQTVVAEGATLAMASTIATMNGGITSGLHISGERLVLSGRGSNTLLMPNNAGSVLNTTYVQTPAGQLAPLVVLDNDDYFNGTGTALETFNSVIPADYRWSGSVGLNASSPIDVRPGTRLSIAGGLDDGTNEDPAGSDLIKIGTGELRLAGGGTYKGTTYVGTSATDNPVVSGSPINDLLNGGAAMPGGILTIAHSAALGQGTNSAADGTVVQSGSAIQLEGNLQVAGERLTISGTGVTSGASSSNPAVTGWHQVGPAGVTNGPTLGSVTAVTAGRVNSVVVDPSDALTMYIATPGGAWKTIDGGISWLPLFDAGFSAPIFSGEIVLDPGNRLHIYLTTGESNNTTDSNAGHGIYQSFDGGQTWSVIPNSDVLFAGLTVTKIVPDPIDPDILYVATSDMQVNSRQNTNNVGVWRYNPNVFPMSAQWVNLTSQVSTARATAAAPLTTPGPDDDFSIAFPQNDATWSDLAVTTTDERDSNGLPILVGGVPFRHTILHASLGTFTGDDRYPPLPGGTFTAPADGSNTVINAVYRLDNPTTTTNPRWYVGGGFVNYGTGTGVPSGINTPNDSYPSSVNNNQYFAGNISLEAVGTARNNTRVIATVSEGVAFDQFRTATRTAGSTGPSQNLLAAYKSTENYNATFTWGRMTLPPDYMGNFGHYAQSLLIFNGTTMFVGGRLGIYRSDSVAAAAGSETWTLVSTDALGDGVGLNIHSMTPAGGRLLVATDSGLFAYDLGANDWTSLNGNLANQLVNGVAVNFNNPTQVTAGTQSSGIVQTDNTLAWNRVETTNARPYGGEVVVDPTNPQILYAFSQAGPADAPGRGGSTGGVLMKSVNGGQTWAALGVPGGGSYQVVDPSLRIDPLNPNRLIVVQAVVNQPTLANGPQRITRIYESLNGGNSWVTLGSNQQNSPDDLVENIPGRNVSGSVAGFQGTYAFDPDFSQVFDVGANTADNQTFVYTDGVDIRITKNRGTTWVTRNLPVGGNVSDVIIDPRNRDTMYALRNDTDGAPQIYKTTDAGQTWQSWAGVGTSALPANAGAWKLVIDPRDSALYLGTDKGVFYAAEGIDAWTEMTLGLPDTQVRDIVLDLDTNTLTVATYGRSVYQTWLNREANEAGALRSVAGQGVWTGDVVLTGDTTFGSDGTQQLRGITNAQLNIVGTIQDEAGSPGNLVTKIGGGTITFSGANTYTGETRIAEGVLVANNLSALGSTTAGTVVENEAALELISSVDGEALTLNGDGDRFGFNGHRTGSLRSVANTNTWSGSITLATDATIGVDSGSVLTASGPVDGAFELTKELTGTLILSGNNTYTGQTDVNQGVLRIASDTALGSTAAGTRVLDGAQLQVGGLGASPAPITNAEPISLSGTGLSGTGALLNVAGSNTLTEDVVLDVNPGFFPTPNPAGVVNIGVAPTTTLTLTGVVSDRASSEVGGETVASGLTKVNTGTLVLAGANTYSGTTTVAGGILEIENEKGLGKPNRSEIQRIVVSAPNPDGDDGFTLTFNGSAGLETTAVIPYLASAADVRMALEALAGITLGDVAVTRDSVFTDTPAGTVTTYVYTVRFAGAYADTPVALMTATGVGGTSAIAAPVADANVGTLVNNGATLQLDLPNGTVTDEALTLNGQGFGGVGALNNVSGNNTWTGSVLNETPITLASSSAIGVSGGSLSVSTGVTGPASSTLTKVGEGTLFFPTANDYAGTTLVNAGILNISDPAALGSATSNEVQRITLTGATTGSFRLTFRLTPASAPEQTVALRVDSINEVDIQTALEALPSINPGDVVVTRVGTTNVYVIEFTGDLGGRDLPQLTGSASIGTAIAITTLTQGGLGATTVASGATLQLAGGITVTQEAVTLNGDGLGGIGAMDSSSGSNTWSGSLTLGSNASVGAQDGAELVLDTSITQATAPTTLTKVGLGTVEMTGLVSNAYTGTTTVTAGTLELNKPGATSIPAGLVIGDGVGLDDSAAVQLLTADQIADAAAVTVNDDGLFSANDLNETVTSVTVNSGRVVVGDNAGTDGTVTVTGSLSMAGGVLDTGDASDRFVLAGTAPVTGSADANGSALIEGAGALELGNTTHVFTIANTSPDFPDLVIDAPITGTATNGLTKTGPGTLALNADNAATLTGRSSVTAGTLQVGGTHGAISLTGSGTVSGTGTVGLLNAGTAGSAPTGTIAPGNNLEFSNQGTLTIDPGAAMVWGSSTKVSLNITDDAFPGQPGGYDRIVVASGSLNLGNAQLIGTVGPDVALGESFTIVQMTNGAVLSGTFAHTTDGMGNDIVYIGGAKFFMVTTPGANGTVVLTRQINTTRTTLASSSNPSVYGQGAGVLFTATVLPGLGDELAGTPPTTTSVVLELRDGLGNLVYTDTVAINASGQAVFDPQTALGFPLAAGTYTAEATFLGSATFQMSEASPLTQTVGKGDTTFTLTGITGTGSSTGTVTLVTGESLDVKVTVNPKSPAGAFSGSLRPSGDVFIRVDNGAETLATLDANGEVTVTVGALSQGTHTVNVRYPGDSNYTGLQTTSATRLVVTVQRGTVSFAVTATPSTAQVGQAVTLTATLNPNSPSSITPVGVVNFYRGTLTSLGTLLGQGVIDTSGIATFLPTTAQLPVGNHVIRAVFAGDSNYSPPANVQTNLTITKVGSSTTLTSSANPANPGQIVTLTAVVARNFGTGVPTGSVRFVRVDTGAILGTVALNSQGRAVRNVSLPVGVHEIRAEYLGNTQLDGSTDTLFQTMAYKSQSSLLSSNNPSSPGTQVTFTATIGRGAGVAGTVPFPAGTVAFFDDSVSTTVPRFTGTVNASGVATWTTNALTTGIHPIRAVYTSTNGYATSTSMVDQAVVYGSTTTVTGPAGTVVTGEAATFTATVVGGVGGSGTPTGTVEFRAGSTVLGTAGLNGAGVATLTTTGLVASNTSVVAVYLGDQQYGTSQGSTDVDVDPASTTTTLASDRVSSGFGQLVSFNATVAVNLPGSGQPLGTVTFTASRVGFAPITSAAIAVNPTTGVATWNVSTLPRGTYTITSVYSGNPSYTGSASNAIPFDVLNAVTTTVTTTRNPALPTQDITLKATVRAATGTPTGAGQPTGQVVFVIDGVDQPPVPLTFTSPTDTIGDAELVIPAGTIPLGTHTVVARYEPIGSTFGQGLSKQLNQTVKGNTTTALTSSAASVTQGDPVTFTATITQVDVPAGSALPTGTVRFFRGTTLIGTSTVADVGGVGTATLVVNNLPVGNLSIRAVYLGDASNTTSTSPYIVQAVLPIASSLAVTPSTTTPAVLAPVTVTVEAISPAGGTAVNFTGSVTASIVSRPLGGTIRGNTPVTFTSGVATFNALQFTKIGRYVIRFRSGTLFRDVVFNVTGGGRLS